MVKLLLDEPDSRLAAQLLADAAIAGETLVAPPLLPVELSNILRQRVRSSLLTAAEAARRIIGFNALPVVIGPATDFALRSLTTNALALANEHNLGATYDAHYIALAQMYGCELWTADERLVNQLAGRLPFVRLLADYPSPPADD